MRAESDKRRCVLAAIVTAAALWLTAVSALASSGGVVASGGGASPSGPETARATHRRGVATWFGPGFYGKRTACGQVLTRRVLGVAHRTLPCGTLVRVTYRGRTLVVPVIDRGPYAHGVTWDLTAGAANALGLTGTGRVGARIVGQVSDSPLLGTPAGSAASAQTGGNPAG